MPRHTRWEVFERLEPRVLLATVHWDGGGGDLLWHNPINWVGDVLPGPEDDVVISLSPGETVVHDQPVETTIRSLLASAGLALGAGSLTALDSWNQTGDLAVSGGVLTVGGEWRQQGDVEVSAGSARGQSTAVHTGSLDITGGMIAVDGDWWRSGPLVFTGGTAAIGQQWIQNGTVSFTGGRVAGPGAVALNDHAHWTGGMLDGAKFQVRPGTRLLIEGDVELRNGTIVNNGLLTWRSGDITVQDSVLWNLANRRFNVQSPGLLGGAAAGTSRIVNLGEIWRNGAGNTSTTVGVMLDNQGVIDVRMGTLDLRGPVVQKIDSATAPTSHLQGGTWRLSSNSARLEMPGNPITAIGSFFIGTPSMPPTIVELGAPRASFPLLESLTRINHGELILSGGTPFAFTTGESFINLGTVTIDNPRLTRLPAGVVLSGGVWNIRQGIVIFTETTSPSLIDIAEGAVAIFAGEDSQLSNVSGPGMLRIQGEVTWKRGEWTGGPLAIDSMGVLRIDGDFTYRSPAHIKVLERRTVNHGTILHVDSWGVWHLRTILANRGNFDVHGATPLSGSPISVGWVGLLPQPGYVINFGTINKLTAATVTFTLAGNLTGPANHVALYNFGLVHVHGGSFTINGGVHSEGELRIEPGARLELGGRPAVLSGGAITGGGLMRIVNHTTWINTSADGGPMVIPAAGSVVFIGTSELRRTGIVNNGSVLLAPGAQVTLIPTVGRFENYGTLELGAGAHLRVDGNAFLGPGQSLSVRLAGPEQFGALTVTGHITLGGSLHARFENGFTPEPGSTFDFLSYNTRTGNFAAVTGSGLAPGISVVFNLFGRGGRLAVADA